MHKHTKRGLLEYLTKMRDLKTLRKGAWSEKFFEMKPRWFEPFIIKKIMSGGVTSIIDLDGEEMLRPINMDRHRRYNI